MNECFFRSNENGTKNIVYRMFRRQANDFTCFLIWFFHKRSSILFWSGMVNLISMHRFNKLHNYTFISRVGKKKIVMKNELICDICFHSWFTLYNYRWEWREQLTKLFSSYWCRFNRGRRFCNHIWPYPINWKTRPIAVNVNYHRLILDLINTYTINTR